MAKNTSPEAPEKNLISKVDYTCLAEGLVCPADFAQTGLNLNEIVVGPTGCGKSFSNAYSRLLHTENSSVVVPVSKKAIVNKFAGMFEQRGYDVMVLDYTNPEQSTAGYDPLRFVHTEADILNLARNIVEAGNMNGQSGNVDPYWNNSATNVIAALIALAMFQAKQFHKRATWGDVCDLYSDIEISQSERFSSNYDKWFEIIKESEPENKAYQWWNTLQRLGSRTYSCIWSMITIAFSASGTDSIIQMSNKEQVVDFTDLGKKKTALFLVSSPMNETFHRFINLMYADMFRELFEQAESNADGRLTVPVHVICDDFACGCTINGFADYISIFRAAGISVTLLLQSESQLTSLYGHHEATTIINNCDTYVYMGGTDIQTCEAIAKRMNKPLTKIMNMPLEQVIVFRRGSEPFVARRYQTLDDPLYKALSKDCTLETENKDGKEGL